MKPAQRPYRVSLLVIPEAMTFTLSGVYEVLGSFGLLSSHDYALPREPPFRVEIVALTRGLAPTASGLPVQAHAGIGEVAATDLVIIPSVMVQDGDWVTGRHPEVVRWLLAMHRNGATLCLVTHDQRYARHADRTIHLFDGQIVDENTAETAARDSGIGSRES